MHFLYAFPDKTKIAGSSSKNADASRTQVVSHVIFIFF